MFQRAFIRASVPLAFSSGFNPHPRLSIPFPRSVGTQSERERVCADVEFAEEPSLADVRRALQAQLPADCPILDVQYGPRKTNFYPERVRYVFFLKSAVTETLRRHLCLCNEEIETKASIEIRRYWAKKRRYKQFDMAPYLEAVSFSEDCVEVVCRVLQSGTVRVDELMQWLTIEQQYLRQPVCRTEIHWCQN